MNKIIKRIKKRLKSKTYWAALAGTVLTIIEANSQTLGQLFPQQYRAYTVMFWPLLMVVLRELTDDALENK